MSKTARTKLDERRCIVEIRTEWPLPVQAETQGLFMAMMSACSAAILSSMGGRIFIFFGKLVGFGLYRLR